MKPKSNRDSTSNTVVARLQHELMTLVMNPINEITAFPIHNDIMKWRASITCPQDSLFSNEKFDISMKYSEQYPYKPPYCRFETPIFHPNIDDEGNICLDILKENWSPIYNARTVLISIQQLIDDPNESDPLSLKAAKAWIEGKESFKKEWKMYKLKNSHPMRTKHK